MPFVWLALAVSTAAVAAAAALATLRGIELFRCFRALGAGVGSEAASIERKTRAIEGHLAAAARSGETLGDEAARLTVSRARLNVLLAALADARAALGKVTGVVPRK